MPSTTIMRFTRSELDAIDEAIKYIDQMFNQKITPQDLSERYNVPPKKLRAGFAKITGLTIHGYIESARLNKAKELLADDAPLKFIAKFVGYSSCSQFGYFFKKHTGQTPMQYRKVAADK